MPLHKDWLNLVEQEVKFDPFFGWGWELASESGYQEVPVPPPFAVRVKSFLQVQELVIGFVGDVHSTGHLFAEKRVTAFVYCSDVTPVRTCPFALFVGEDTASVEKMAGTVPLGGDGGEIAFPQRPYWKGWGHCQAAEGH